MDNKKKRIISLVVIIVAVMLLAVIWYVSSTQWTRDFDLRYVKYVTDTAKGNYSGKSYALYEITNTTDRTLKDVSVVISVDSFSSDFKYEDKVASRIRPGETVEYKLYSEDYEKAAEEQGESIIILHSVDIVEIEYSS